MIIDAVDFHSDDPIVTLSALNIIDNSLKSFNPEDFKNKKAIL